MSYTDPITWVAGNPLAASELNTYVRDNLRFLHDKGSDLTAANTITPVLQFHKVTGNTQINNITVLAAGTRVVLLFTGTPLLKNANGGGGQLHLPAGADYQVTANETLQFITDGTDWYIVNVSSPPFSGCNAYHDVSQNTSSTVVMQVALNAEDYDVGGYHDPAALNTRLTIPSPGKYAVQAYVPFADSIGAGQGVVKIKWTSGASVKYLAYEVIQASASNPGDLENLDNTVRLSHPGWQFAAADYVEIEVLQRSGGVRAISGRAVAENPAKGVQFAIRRLA